MWGRWEQDPAALRFAPYIPQGLMNWLQEQNMVGHPPHTHLVMPRGPFLSVPAAARAEFHERHAAEWDRNHIPEIGRSQCFQLFFDIDGLDLDSVVLALPPLRALTGVPLVVTGIEGPPPGYHVFAPRVTVDSCSAFEFRKNGSKRCQRCTGTSMTNCIKTPNFDYLEAEKSPKMVW